MKKSLLIASLLAVALASQKGTAMRIYILKKDGKPTTHEILASTMSYNQLAAKVGYDCMQHGLLYVAIDSGRIAQVDPSDSMTIVDGMSIEFSW